MHPTFYHAISTYYIIDRYIIGANCSRTLALSPAKENLRIIKDATPRNPRTVTPAWNYLMQAHNRQINTMQQTIVMNECMNRKNEEF
jgi:hypothetical protein